MISVGASVSRPADHPLVPPELSGGVPRRVALSAGGVAVAVVAIAFAVGAVASIVALSVAYERSGLARQLRERDAVAAQALIAQIGRTRGEHPRRVVTYQYEVDGSTYVARTTLRQSDRRDLAVGAPIAIAYLTSSPETSWLGGYEPRGMPLWAIPLLALTLLGTAGVLVWILRHQWMLLSEGRAALARVVATTRVRSDKHKRYRVRYQFQTLSGATCTASYDAARTPPPVGAIVPIVYHRDRPQWSAAYPMALVRPRRS